MLIDKKLSVNHLEPNVTLDDGITYINTSQWMLAYALFAYLYKNAKVKSVVLLYNMALCYHFANEYTKATAVLTEALTQISIPSISSQSKPSLPSELLNHEYENSQYRYALNETAVELNLDLVKLRARRLLVDVQLALGNWQEVIRLSALPDMDKCKNVLEALAIAKSKNT